MLSVPPAAAQSLFSLSPSVRVQPGARRCLFAAKVFAERALQISPCRRSEVAADKNVRAPRFEPAFANRLRAA